MRQTDDPQTAVRQIADPERARQLQRYFKTGPGEYAEGDVFVGLTVPQIRQLARHFSDLPFARSLKLLQSKIHEERLLALLIWVRQFRQGNEMVRRKLYHAYLRHARFVNNWDLVDLSATILVGEYLAGRSKAPLRKLAGSKLLWNRRIAVVATYRFIKAGHFRETLALAKILLNDQHDLMHKAVGWMLREVGKRDMKVLEMFLKGTYHRMPRTMLRYAIEKFPETRRQKYLRGNI